MDCLTLVRAARENSGEVEHLGELRVREKVVLELDRVEVTGKLEKALLMVDNKKHRVVLVNPLVLERRPWRKHQHGPEIGVQP